MENARNNIIRLQELSFIANNTKGEKLSPSAEREIEELKQSFAQVNKEVDAFFAKIFPQAIDVICSLNRSISRQGYTLFFKNQEVPSFTLTDENFLSVCREAVAAFTDTLNEAVAELTSGRALSEEISIRFCRQFNTVSCFKNNSERLLCERIKKIKNHSIPANVETEDKTDSFSKLINIPLGKKGEAEFSIDLDVSSPDAHAAVTGITGSGKSSLLHSLILGGAYKYSPEQLQFWILDFKDGTGFIHFKALKHVKVMCINNRAIDTKEMMEHISREYVRRSKLITESGGGDIRTYNQRAKAKNLPLMPRLIIVIDEFTVMHRSCYNTLNDIVVRGRALGMGFIFSSQSVDANALYGNAIQQTRHLFEFTNFDGTFGRLVKGVTDEEKRFVDYKLHGKGNCIYRNDSNRVLFRCAYAGDIDGQSEFIEEINEKWKNFPYSEPVIAGKPKRKFIDFSSIKVKVEEVKNEFKNTKKIFVPLGETGTGEKYLYKIDKDNSRLIVFGDETRVASVEASVIERFKALAGDEKSVFYIDLNCNPDREVNAVTANYNSNSSEICYADTDENAKAVIDKIYKILNARRQLARTDKTKDIGNPIELIIHNAERISELKEEKYRPRLNAITRNFAQTDTSNGVDLKADLANIRKPAPAVNDGYEEISTVKKLCEIIENGKNSRIFVMLYFEEKNRFQNLMNDLFSYNYDFKDVLVVPKIPDEGEELSYSEITDSLTACRLREQASLFSQTDEKSQSVLEKSDFICVVLVDDKVPHKIIPYEWREVKR